MARKSRKSYQQRRDALGRAQRISYLLDYSIRLPLVGIRIGLDGLVGLIPGVGDAIGGLAAFYMIILADRAGYSSSTKLKMALIAFADFAIGLVPIVGDIADFFFKGHRHLARVMANELESDATSISSTEHAVYV